MPGVPLTFTDLVNQTIETHEKLFPLLKKKYPAYKPFVPTSPLPSLDASTWLILEDAANALKVPLPKSPMRSSKLIDGKVWDGKDPKAYAASFAIKA